MENVAINLLLVSLENVGANKPGGGGLYVISGISSLVGKGQMKSLHGPDQVLPPCCAAPQGY